MIAQGIALCLAVTLTTVSEPAVTEPPADAELEPTVAEPPPPTIVPPAPPQPVEVDPRNYRMVLAGDIVIGFGGAGLLAMLVGLGLRSDALAQRRALGVAAEPDAAAIARQDRRIETGTLLTITGGVAAGALFATGITLVALGHARERKRRESSNLIPAPSFDRHAVVLRWTIRF